MLTALVLGFGLVVTFGGGIGYSYFGAFHALFHVYSYFVVLLPRNLIKHLPQCGWRCGKIQRFLTGLYSWPSNVLAALHPRFVTLHLIGTSSHRYLMSRRFVILVSLPTLIVERQQFPSASFSIQIESLQCMRLEVLFFELIIRNFGRFRIFQSFSKWEHDRIRTYYFYPCGSCSESMQTTSHNLLALPSASKKTVLGYNLFQIL